MTGSPLMRQGNTALRFGYADPPYPGMSHFYKDHPDYAGEVDHAELVKRLLAEYDGWILHTASSTLAEVLAICPADVRVMAWTKPFASWKKGVCLGATADDVMDDLFPGSGAVSRAWESYCAQPRLAFPLAQQTEAMEVDAA